MGHCKDCEFWKRIKHSKIGPCSQLDTHAHGNGDHSILQILPRLKDHSIRIEVWEDFGCTYFKEKQPERCFR